MTHSSDGLDAIIVVGMAEVLTEAARAGEIGFVTFDTPTAVDPILRGARYGRGAIARYRDEAIDLARLTLSLAPVAALALVASGTAASAANADKPNSVFIALGILCLVVAAVLGVFASAPRFLNSLRFRAQRMLPTAAKAPALPARGREPFVTPPTPQPEKGPAMALKDILIAVATAEDDETAAIVASFMNTDGIVQKTRGQDASFWTVDRLKTIGQTLKLYFPQSAEQQQQQQAPRGEVVAQVVTSRPLAPAAVEPPVHPDMAALANAVGTPAT